jgi:hypothetical protein
MSFSLTSSGFTFTNANQETKSIVIDDATNTINFQQFNISTPSVSNKDYVDPTPPVDISGNYSDEPWWSGGIITQTGTSATFNRPGSVQDGDTLTITGSIIAWNVGAEQYGVTGTITNNIITWSNGNTWERAVAAVDLDFVSYWPLTSISNGTTPDIINGYDMDVVNMDATNIVTGRTGVGSLAFSFDSQSNTVLTRTDTAIHPLPIGKQTEYTISYWLKMVITGTNFSFVNTGSAGVLLATHTANPFSTFHANPSQGNHVVSNSASDPNPADGNWHHVTLTKTTDVVNIYEIYIDGVMTKTHSAWNSIVLDVDTTSIGAQRETIGHIDGEMSEVAVWKRALSASEVSQLANGTKPVALI